MNDWISFFYYFIIGAAMMLTVMGLWFTFILPFMDRWSRRFFTAYFSVLFLCSLASLIDLIVFRVPSAEPVARMLVFLESLTISVPIPMLTAYLVHCRGTNVWKSRLFRLVTPLWLGFFLLLGTTPFTRYLYFIGPDRQFHRGPWFPLLIAPLIVTMCLNLGATLRSRRTLSRKYYFGFLTAVLPLTVMLAVHALTDVTALLDISTVLSALSLFGLILSDQTEAQLRQQREIARQQQEIARQQREIANQRASVMVLQMRPHFICNTLMSIYSLCSQDPQKARQVTLDFTNYLRKNFNAVASDSPIPFSAELEHTRAYLAVEQAQFEELLRVEYDTPVTQFRLPPLTLQPLVENAVKHGMNPWAGPLSIAVRTERSEAGFELTVEDSGPGFDPSDAGQPHATLTNIRQRLEMMCGGTMTVAPRDGGGAVVRITIPSAPPSA